MAKLKLDHVITSTNIASIDVHLDDYRKAGFLPVEYTVRLDPGLRNGFIAIGPEYVEFAWVENADEFNRAAVANPILAALRAIPRPFRISFVTEDISAVHDEWTARGYDLPPIQSLKPQDAQPDDLPLWSLFDIPPSILRGVWFVVEQYHRHREGGMQEISMSPNTIYAMVGITFVSNVPGEQAARWRDVFALAEPVQREEGIVEVRLGPHVFTWMTPEKYQDTYRLPWEFANHPFGEIAILHLHANSLEKAHEMLYKAGRETAPISSDLIGGDGILILPDIRDGLTFLVTECPVQDWLDERTSITGEHIRVI